MRDADPPYLYVDISVRRESCDESDLLAALTASFYERADAGAESNVGTLTGWIAWNILDEDLADAADAVSADAADIGYVGSLALAAVQETDPFVDDVLLIDRLYLEKDYRGRGLVQSMVELILRTLRLDVVGCVVVTDPEPQRESDGPYPDGPERDAAMAGLVRTLAESGFQVWPGGKVMWQLVAR